MKKRQPIGGSADVAERVRAERERRGWSYRDLAAAMAESGYPISKDTLQRIEEACPRPKIGIDQVVAFADVFGLGVEEMLAPARWVKARQIAELEACIRYQRRNIAEAEGSIARLTAELSELKVSSHGL